MGGVEFNFDGMVPNLKGLPRSHVNFFLGRIGGVYYGVYGDKAGCSLKEGSPFCEIVEAKILVGENGDRGREYDVSHGHWLGEGCGFVEAFLGGSKRRVEFSGKGASLDKMKFDEVYSVK